LLINSTTVISQAAGTSFTVSVNTAQVSGSGTYTGQVIVYNPSNPAGDQVTITVTINVTGSGSAYSVTPTSLTFTSNGSAPPGLSLAVIVPSSSPNYSYSISYAGVVAMAWLSMNGVQFASGLTGPATLPVAVNPTGLPVGTYNALITIATSQLTFVVPVTLNVTASAIAAPASLTFASQIGVSTRFPTDHDRDVRSIHGIRYHHYRTLMACRRSDHRHGSGQPPGSGGSDWSRRRNICRQCRHHDSQRQPVHSRYPSGRDHGRSGIESGFAQLGAHTQFRNPDHVAPTHCQR
jgi:hypothetical protein